MATDDIIDKNELGNGIPLEKRDYDGATGYETPPNTNAISDGCFAGRTTLETIKIHSEVPPKCDADVFYVVGTLHPTSFTEGRVEDADYIAHVLWVPQTNKLIFKIWDEDGAYSSWN